MDLEPEFDVEHLLKDIDKQVNMLIKAIIDQYKKVGDEFVKLARENGEYTDRTGNLRSSVGYVVFVDGKMVFENFEESENGTDKYLGTVLGRSTAYEDIPDEGICLVVVAGMSYAAAVESKGFDVITGSSYEAEKLLNKAMETVKKVLNED
jgi:hypothetical protein